jgi:hypothetical protein
MNSRRITKVKCKPTESGWGVEIHEVETRGSESAEHTVEVVHRCREEPAPELPAALRALAPHVRAILELPEDFAEHRLSPTQVSYSMSKNNIEGAVISGHVSLLQGDGVWGFNTPHLPFEPYGDKPMACLSDDAVGAVEAVRVQAQRYLDGERAQAGLFDGKMAAAGERVEITSGAQPEGPVLL